VRLVLPKISDLKRNTRRQQVLDAALACFSENGFHQTGMADIVQRSGMSHGAVYGYFQSKDDIIEALADDRHAGEALLNSLGKQKEDPIEAIQEIVRAYAHWLIEPDGGPRRRVSVHGWAEALRSERVRARVVEGIDSPRSMIAGIIEKAQREGRMSRSLSAEAIARSFVALFQGLVLQVTWGEKIDVAACVAIVDRMLEGLGHFEPQAKARPVRGK
jgi:AcrR family transcriptional regulator